VPRFFVDQKLEPGTFILKGEDVHHIKDVLRLLPGDQIVLCDSAGSECSSRIEGYSPGSVMLTILDCVPGRTEPPYQVTLFQGLPKGDKMDAIIQKAVELGAMRIVPVRCSRSVPKITPAEAVKKTARWQRIAGAAASQCGRGKLPEVSLLADFAQAAGEASSAAIRLMPWEGERSKSIRDYLEKDMSQPVTGQPVTISILIGPEGGFSADEVELARQAGIQTVTIGRRILRTETAGAAVLAMLIYQFADF
jgi:16S rRNA (uracil1498-N3)-methyltransferase